MVNVFRKDSKQLTVELLWNNTNFNQTLSSVLMRFTVIKPKIYFALAKLLYLLYLFIL